MFVDNKKKEAKDHLVGRFKRKAATTIDVGKGTDSIECRYHRPSSSFDRNRHEKKLTFFLQFRSENRDVRVDCRGQTRQQKEKKNGTLVGRRDSWMGAKSVTLPC